MNYFDIRNKVVVLTGACGLIGRGIAEAFHQAEAKLILADLPSANPEEFARQLGKHSIGVSCDVGDSRQTQNLLKVCLLAFSRTDILINCHQHKPRGFLKNQAETFPEDLWDAILNTNLKGTFLTCRDFGEQMIQQKKGTIINFASVYGVVSSNPALYQGNSMGNPVAYSASKGGVIMLTKYLAAHWARYGVRVNCVTPHGVFNHHEKGFENRFRNFSPMGRMMTSQEVLGAIFFLASEASSYVTGSNLIMDGGWTAW